MKILLAIAALLFSPPSIDASPACEAHRVGLQILGSGGPELNDQRASSSYLLRLDGKASILVDTGSGSSLNFERSGAQISDLKAILFTHFHVDHSADFPAYVKGSFFTAREQLLRVFGPSGNTLMPSTTQFVEAVLGASGAYRYLNNYVDPAQPSPYKIAVNDVPSTRNQVFRYALLQAVAISAIAVHHGPIAAVAWRVDAYGCSISFSGDMSNRYQALAGLVTGSDILVAHNAIPENADGAARNLHMPPSEIGAIAQRASVKRLVLSHRMQRTLGKEQEAKRAIQSVFSGPIVFANDLDEIELQ